MSGALRIDIWSDVVCPWCYIGKRRLEAALGQFEHADEVDIHWHSFQLDPTHPKGHREPIPDHLAAKFGASPADVQAMIARVSDIAAGEGLTYALDQATSVNTRDAHRLAHLAAASGLGGEMHERLMSAHLVESEVVDDVDTLVRLASEVGLDADEARRVLEGDEYGPAFATDLREARRLGITGVPTFVLNSSYALSGAQPTDTFLSALRTAYGDTSADAAAS